MAEEPELKPIENEEPEETPGYKAPAQKTLDEIKNLDADDESLTKYKQTLLGGVQTGVVVDANNPLNCIVTKLSMVCEGRPDVELDLKGNLSKLSDSPIIVKEGAVYKLKISFYVQRDIITGLKYHHVIYRKGIKVDKASYMVGSYGPKAEIQEYLSPQDEAPKGMISRGSYKVKSKFIDDDKNMYLEWEWGLDIKKDWEN